MARLEARPDIGLRVVFSISEEEARALDALVGYGDDEFIKAFKERLGEAYLRNHENGLREFFVSVRKIMPNILHKVDSARQAFNGETK